MAWSPDYATTADLRAFMRIGDNEDDAVLTSAITAASRAVDQATNRQFGLVAAPEPRDYPPRFDVRSRRWMIDVDDVMTTVGLTAHVDLDGDQTFTHEITDYGLLPSNSANRARPWTTLVVQRASTVQPRDPTVDQVRVTARWGWTTVPDAIRNATLLQASRLVTRRDSPFGVAGSPDMGSELRLLAKVDPDVEVTVRPYRRVWGAA
jgi:hypothetical protein